MSNFTPFSLQDVNYSVRPNHVIDSQLDYHLSLDTDILNMYNNVQRTSISEEILRYVSRPVSLYYYKVSSPLRSVSVQFTVQP